MHLNRRHDARGNALPLQRILKRQGIDDGGEHAHVITRDAIHLMSRGGDTAKDVAAAQNQADLDACSGDFRNLAGERLSRVRDQGRNLASRPALHR